MYIKKKKKSKEIYLLGQSTTWEFSGNPRYQKQQQKTKQKTTLKQQLYTTLLETEPVTNIE